MPRAIGSKIILCRNIKMDREYNNVIDYTENQMVELCQANKIADKLGYSYIRHQNTIQTSFSISQCLQANYIAFQNPDYSNKWFFAFIDDVKYIGENNTEIIYTIDVWSTFFKSLTIKPCFVVREHVNDDTIGLHTIPENVEMGDYKINILDYYNKLDDLVYIIQCTEEAISTGIELLALNYGGIYMAGGAYITDNIEDFIFLLRVFNNKEGGHGMEAIYNCYMVPKQFTNFDDETEKEVPADFRMHDLNQPIEDTYTVTKPILLDGYSPKNNKLKTYPFVALEINNNNGVSNVLKYEDFISQDNLAHFKIKGVPTVGGSIKLIPIDYKAQYVDNEEEGIMAGKFPTLNWTENNYLMWLSQQAVNLQQGLQSAGLQIVGGTVASIVGLPEIGAGMIGSGVGNAGGSIMNHLMQKQVAQFQPNTARGNTNGGDINVTSHKNGFFFYGKSIKREYAKVIDDYFTRQGYQINETKIPNITGRPAFNYIKIADSECIGYGSIPSNFMETLNKICRRGVTIWHNHLNLGDYSVNNQIQ